VIGTGAGGRTGWVGLGVVLVAAVIAPFVFTDFFVAVILTKSLWLGIAAASLIFLSAYGGMVSLAQVGIYGIAGMTFANLVQADGGSAAAWSPWAAALAAIVVATAVGLAFGTIAARSVGIYFLMITLAFSCLVFYFFSQVAALSASGGSTTSTCRRSSATPGAIRSRCTSWRWPSRCSCSSRCATSRARRSAWSFRVCATSPHDARPRLRRHAPPGPGLRAGRLHRSARRGPVGLVQPPHLAGFDQPGADDRRPDRRRHRRPVPARGRVGRRDHLRAARQLLREWTPTVGNVLGAERFNTILGIVFLVIVLASPGGIVGLWDQARDRLTRLRGRPPSAPVASEPPGGSPADATT
jgi:branched-chain amino acid transport system permease protein